MEDAQGGGSLTARVAGLGSRNRSAGSAASDERELARRLGGRLLADGLILRQKRFPIAATHGTWPLRIIHQQARGLAEAAGVDPRRLAFLDTETTGLSGGCGTRIFLLGLARIDRGLLLSQYLLSRVRGEEALLDAARAWLREDDVLDCFNGKSFDVPLLGSRYRLARRADPFSERDHIDLLHPVRRAFSRQWPDCRLASVEKRLLRFQRQHDLPGSEAPSAWVDWLRRGEPVRLAAVCQHNQWDLVSLAVLLPVLSRVYADPQAYAADPLPVARAQLSRGRSELAMRILCQGRRHLDEGGLLELARLYRRKGRWRQALGIWKRLAAAGSEEARERLAKYFEHVTGDCAEALAYALRLPQHAASNRHRCLRLERKLAGSPADRSL